MKKNILALCTAVFLLCLPSLCAEAKETASIPTFDVHFNGNRIDSLYREYPLLLYKDITYFPMTYFDSRHLGLVTEWDSAARTLEIRKEGISAAYRTYAKTEKNAQVQEVELCDFNITIWGNAIDNSSEEYPLLTFRDVTYFPLTWRFAHDLFGWEYGFSPEAGLSIHSDVKNETVRLHHLDGVFAMDDLYYYYVGYQDGKQSLYRADLHHPANYTVLYDFPENYAAGNGKCLVGVETDMGSIFFKYHIGGAIMGSDTYVKITPDGTAVEEPPKNYFHSGHGIATYYKENEDMSLVVKHEYFDGPSEIYYTIDGVEKQAEMHPDKPHIMAYQEGKTASGSVRALDLIQILGKNIYFVGKNPGTATDSALYRIDTLTGTTEKILENVGAFHAYQGLGREFFEGWGYKEATPQDQSENVIFDRGGTLYGYNVKTGTLTAISGTASGKFITAVGNFVAQQNLETRTDTVTILGKPANMQLYNEVLFSTTGGASMYPFGDSLVYQALSEMPEDKIRLAVLGNVFFYSSDVARNVFVGNAGILYSFGDSELVARVDF